MASCVHLERAEDTAAPSSVGECSACIEEGRHDWVHLRKCLECGLVGCCDSSPRKHASLHYGEEHHPVIRSAEPGEQWRWCFVDETVG
jgi:Zn-finger in ubiquitin-hydrolases and other protein